MSGASARGVKDGGLSKTCPWFEKPNQKTNLQGTPFHEPYARGAVWKHFLRFIEGLDPGNIVADIQNALPIEKTSIPSDRYILKK